MNRLDEHHAQLFEAQEKAVRIEAEGLLSEEEIKAKCTELRNYILEKDTLNNGFINPKLTKIWNSKRKL